MAPAPLIFFCPSLTRLSTLCSALVVRLPTLPKREMTIRLIRAMIIAATAICGDISPCARLTRDDRARLIRLDRPPPIVAATIRSCSEPGTNVAADGGGGD